MVAYKIEQPLWGSPLGVQTGDARAHFQPFLGRFLGDDVPPQFEYLPQARPVAVAHQSLTCSHIALLDAPMPEVHRAGGLLPVTRWRQRKDYLEISPELRLMGFDD